MNVEAVWLTVYTLRLNCPLCGSTDKVTLSAPLVTGEAIRARHVCPLHWQAVREGYRRSPLALTSTQSLG